MLILDLVGYTKPRQFSMDGIDGGTDDDAVGDAGGTEGCLMFLIVKEFLGEELLEFEPSSGFVRGVGFFQSSQALFTCGSSRKWPREMRTMVASDISSGDFLR